MIDWTPIEVAKTVLGLLTWIEMFAYCPFTLTLPLMCATIFLCYIEEQEDYEDFE